MAKKYVLEEGQSSIVRYEVIPKEITVDDETFEKLWELHPEEFGKIKIMGKVIYTPRWQQSYGKNYKFSGMDHPAMEVPKGYTEKLLKWVCDHSGKNYSQVLINWYADGNHYIGWHSDDERDLVDNSDIYSFSFGESRDFIIKSKKKDFKETFNVKNNSLIIMCGETQKYYLHSVPKRVKSRGRRINITFRLFR
ncbi:MAG: alkylated DNA repair dioxygenase [Hyperionvirus sp.]|uniref:Alkylated DNA repair dioxygenase n=1 Tax=Hyperionvirus sp. TaxID=2487770 RepID=A0A3G5ABG7_9VIRU|nr:MAG: alkylated DNA repair dioxygenase [Hyperionvirus sp.]